MAESAQDPNLNPPPGPGPSFWEGLPPEIRDHETIKGYAEKDDFAGVAKALVNAQSKLGERPLQLPDADAPEADKAAFWAQLGRPEESTGYEITYPENYTATEMERELEPKWQQLFHDAHLTGAQASVLQAGYHQMIAQFNAQLQELEQAAQVEGDAQIARNYPDRRQFESDERAGIRAAAGNDETAMRVLQELRLSTGALLHTHPAFRMAMARVGGSLGEDHTSLDQTTQHRYATSHDIEAEIAREQARAKTDPAHPGHPNSTASTADQQRYREKMWQLTERKWAKAAP